MNLFKENLNSFEHYAYQIIPELEIVIVTIKELKTPILKEINEQLLNCKEHPNSRYYPVLLDLSNLVSADQEIKQFISNVPELLSNQKAFAFLLASKINESFFSDLERLNPKIPVKAFHYLNKQEALAWLQQLDKHPKVKAMREYLD